MTIAIDYTGGATLITSATAPTVHSHDVKAGVDVSENWRIGILKNRVDFSDVGGLTQTTGDTYYVLAIPAYTIVLRVWLKTVEVELTGPTGTVIIGDSSATTVFMNTATAPSTTVGGVISALAADTGAANVIAGKFYASADYIRLTTGTDHYHNLVLDCYALIVDCRVATG